MEQNFAFTVNLLGILLPFFGTALGAAAVLFLRRNPGRAASGLLMGFAAGVMTAASVWSLLLPAVEAAAVSHETGTAVVTLKADVDNDTLKKAVEDQDYTVTGIQ